jgi:ribosome-associated translation inhibitor RaiA
MWLLGVSTKGRLGGRRRFHRARQSRRDADDRIAMVERTCYSGCVLCLPGPIFVSSRGPLSLSYFGYKGAQMKISISYKRVELREPVEAETARYLGKLGRLLKSYAPDLVQLHGSIEKHPRKVEYSFSLNLSLPTGTLHSTGIGPDVRQSVKKAFSELEGQVKKHQSRLRKDYQWRRRRPRAEVLA